VQVQKANKNIDQVDRIIPAALPARGHKVDGLLVTEDAFREAESVTRDLAAQMLAFAYNETFARSILVHVLRYDPREASEGLFAISWTTRVAGNTLKNRPRERVAKGPSGEHPLIAGLASWAKSG